MRSASLPKSMLQPGKTSLRSMSTDDVGRLLALADARIAGPIAPRYKTLRAFDDRLREIAGLLPHTPAILNRRVLLDEQSDLLTEREMLARRIQTEQRAL